MQNDLRSFPCAPVMGMSHERREGYHVVATLTQDGINKRAKWDKARGFRAVGAGFGQIAARIGLEIAA
ncbi:MAG: hypothetical protein K2X76_06640 [Sphingomonas sp.]|nr:hypothetical protein [Sphingomonas sp.]